jgi:hypothetical protein
VTIIPLGHPETGAGGASHAVDEGLIGLGGLALAGAVVTTGVALRRRRPAGVAGVVRSGRDESE